MQYAILFDRILRFPITGNRVRNYDGLGGQLLFAFLHQNEVVRWTDNRLSIDWERVEDAVAALRDAHRDAVPSRHRPEQGLVLDRRPRSRLGVRASRTSARSGSASAVCYSDEADPRAWIDRVLDDEFPLSTFYLSLQKKLAEELVGLGARRRLSALDRRSRALDRR